MNEVYQRRTGLPLDKMTITTHVTTIPTHDGPGGPTAYPVNGMFVHGLMMEGARWESPPPADTDGEAPAEGALTPGQEAFTVHGTRVGGRIHDSRLKELLAPMPVLYLEAVPVQASWIPASVGLLRNDPTVFDCPVYTTTFRGPSYVFLSTMRTIDPISKWTLAGVALVLQDDN